MKELAIKSLIILAMIITAIAVGVGSFITFVLIFPVAFPLSLLILGVISYVRG